MAEDLRARLERIRDTSPDEADRKRATAMLRDRFGVGAQPATPAGPRQADPDPAKPPTYGEKVAAALDPAAAYHDWMATADRFNRGVTLGLYPWLTDKLGLDSPERRAQTERAATQAPADMPYLDTAKNLATDTAAAAAGSVTVPVKGVHVGGVPGAIAQNTDDVVRAATPSLSRSGAGRVAQTTASGVASGAQMGAVQATSDGATPEQTLEAAGHSAVTGGVFGGVLQVLGNVAGAAGRAITESRGGQARKLVEKHGGEVGPTTPGRGIPELKGRQPTDRDVGEVSRESAAKVLQGMEDEYFSGTVAPHQAQKAAIAQSPAGQTAAVDARPVFDALETLSKSQKLLPGEASAVYGIAEQMKSRMGKDGKIPMSHTELNDIRQKLWRASNQQAAGQGGAQTVPQDLIEDVAGVTKQMVDEGPYGATNKAYHEGTKAYESQRGQLDLPARPRGRPSPEGPSEQEVAKVGNMLARDQQNSTTAGVRNSDRVEKFVEQNPQYERAVEMPRVLEAVGDLSFTTGGGAQRGGLINRLPPGIGLGASGALMFAGDPRYAAAPLSAELLARNLSPIAGRYLYNPALAVQRAPDAAPRLIPPLVLADPFDAVNESRKAKQKKAQKKD